MKFKVWDSKNKCWEPSCYKTFYIDTDGDLNIEEDRETGSAPDNFVPVFSVGKTDKNKGEYFEGDIVRFKDYHSGWNPRLQKNKWDAICLIEWNQKECKFSMTEVGGNQYCFASTHWFCLSGVIIGSKYENPELLNEI